MKPQYKIVTAIMLGILLGSSMMWGCHRHIYLIEYQKWQRSFKDKSGQWIVLDYTSSIADDVDTLVGLHQGKINYLIELKEQKLSEEIQELSSKYPNEALLDTNNVKVFKMAARYRDKYPFQTGNTNIDVEVEKFLEEIRKMR